MKQSLALITLGVSDYERAKAFYAALGWSTTLEIQETAFFQANGVVSRCGQGRSWPRIREWSTTARAGAASRWLTTLARGRRSTA